MFFNAFLGLSTDFNNFKELQGFASLKILKILFIFSSSDFLNFSKVIETFQQSLKNQTYFYKQQNEEALWKHRGALNVVGLTEGWQ